MAQQKCVLPVAGVGPRRESSSWYNLRDRDTWQKAGANGKRLRDILDKLLEQDPKRALQEIEKLIKKHGSSPPFSACKAIALHRLDSFGRDVRVGKTCLDLIDGIPVNAESDDFTVQCVIHYYQHETADYERLHQFLQKVWNAKKGNIAILEVVLTMYIRHHNPKELQKVAMDLAKADAQHADRHYMMAVFSLVMQAIECADAGKRRTLLSLAYRTLDKRFPKPAIESAMKMWTLYQIEDVIAYEQLFETLFRERVLEDDEVNFSVMFMMWFCKLLLKKGDLDKIDSVIRIIPPQFYGQDVVDVLARKCLRQFLIALSRDLKDFTDTDSIYLTTKTLMETNLNTITALPVSNDSPYFLQAENIKAIAELEFVFLFITENHTAGGDVMLPPAVADVCGNLAQEAMVDLLINYLNLFGSKACFFTDIKRFLAILVPETAHKILEGTSSLNDLIKESNFVHPSTVADVIRHQNELILNFSFRRLLGKPEENESDTINVVRRLLALQNYASHTAPFAASQRPDMVSLGDTYACLAVFVLFDLFKKDEEWINVEDSIVMIETMMKKEKHLCNPALRILLIHLYLRCGAVLPAYEHFKILDIKSLQLNHLGYLLLSPLTVCGVPSASMELTESLLRFFTSTIFECYESQMQSIGKEEYFILIDLENLKKDLKYSSAAVQATYSHLWSIPFRRNLTDWETRAWLVDTERYIGQGFSKLWVDSGDRDVIPSWDMAFERQVKRRQLETQQLEIAWVTILKGQMRSYQYCITLASTYVRFNPMDARSLKDQLSDQLPPEQADNAAEAASALKETSAGYFEDCKSVASMLNSHLQQASDKNLVSFHQDHAVFREEVDHITSSFPHPIKLYFSLGCHALHLRICRLVLAVDKVISSTLPLFGGLSAFPAVDGEGQGSKEDAGDENLSGNGATKDAKLIGDALQGPEIPLKLEQMISVIFDAFNESPVGDYSRYRDLIASLSLLLQVVRSGLWIVQCLKTSLLAIHSHNETRGKSSDKTADFRKLLDDWMGEFLTFIDDVAHPVNILFQKIQQVNNDLKLDTADGAAVPSLLSAGDGPDNLARIPFAARFCREFAPVLLSELPETETVEETAANAEKDIKSSWKTSLTALCAECADTLSLLHQFIEEIRARSKTKLKA